MLEELLDRVRKHFPAAAVVAAEPIERCAGCGADDALIYFTMDDESQYCGKCCRSAPLEREKPKKQRGKALDVKESAQLETRKFERPLWHLPDSESASEMTGCELVTAEKPAEYWQERGHGIFWTVNRFKDGLPRKIDNLVDILAWAVDIDEGTKDEQKRRFLGAPLRPSMIVETKRGYQAYWNARDGVAHHWNAIVLDRLVPYFGADVRARDLARILRAPGYKHLKDPRDPFMVRIVHQDDVAYTEDQILALFPDANKFTRDEKARRIAEREYQPVDAGDDFWANVWALDCEEGLRRLSGHPSVAGERYTFRPVTSGNINIVVNGKGTSCWIDRNKRIGSLDGGGPGLYQWLRWFKNSPAECARVIKEIFPQLARKRQ